MQPHITTIPLARLIRNLLSNAVRYTDSGGVVLGCGRTGSEVRIEVWDTGKGIPANRHDEIFHEFYQLDNPERDRRKGLGLGLAIVKRLAKLLNYRVSLRSVIGKGSMFAITLPCGSRRGVEAGGGAVWATLRGRLPPFPAAAQRLDSV